LPDGRVRIVITPDYEFKPPLYEIFERLIALLSNATERVWHRRNEFPARMGIRFEEAQSLSDELLLIRYDVLGRSRPIGRSIAATVVLEMTELIVAAMAPKAMMTP
jgi:hypothetical protein